MLGNNIEFRVWKLFKNKLRCCRAHTFFIEHSIYSWRRNLLSQPCWQASQAYTHTHSVHAASSHTVGTLVLSHPRPCYVTVVSLKLSSPLSLWQQGVRRNTRTVFFVSCTLSVHLYIVELPVLKTVGGNRGEIPAVYFNVTWMRPYWECNVVNGLIHSINALGWFY